MPSNTDFILPAQTLALVNDTASILAQDRTKPILAYGSVFFQLTGTWVGTVTFETTTNGSTWVPQLAQNQLDESEATTTTANGQYVVNALGKYGIRAKWTARTSGSIVVTVSATWAQYTTGADGEPGADGADGTDGNTVLSGVVAPVDLTDGVNGDFFINTVTGDFYGPKTAGAWGAVKFIMSTKGITQNFSNAPVTVNENTNKLIQTGTLSADRIVTLPDASLYLGFELIVFAGLLDGFKLYINPASGQTLEGEGEGIYFFDTNNQYSILTPSSATNWKRVG